MLVMATMRLRLTAFSLASLQAPAQVRHHRHRGMTYAKATLAQAAVDLATFYERIAVLVGRPMANQVLMPVSAPSFSGLDGPKSSGADGAQEASGVSVLQDASRADGTDGQDGAGDPDGADGADGADFVRIITGHRHPHLLWVAEHLQHLSAHAQVIGGPASHVAEQRRQPWWR